MGDPLLPPPPPKKKPTEVTGSMLPPPPKKEEIVVEEQQTGSRAFDPFRKYESQSVPEQQVSPGPKPKPVLSGDITGIYSEEEAAMLPEKQNPVEQAHSLNRIDNLKAEGLDQYSPSRSSQYDVNKAVRSSRGKAGFSDETAQANQALKAMEDDYMDYLSKTDPSKYEYTKNEIEGIRREWKEDGKLNTAQQEKLLKFQKDAIDAHDKAAELNILNIRQSSDVDVFQKQSGPIMSELEGVVKEMQNLGVDPNNQNSPSKVQAYNALVQRQNQLVESLDKLRGVTGFTNEKEDELIRASRAISGPETEMFVTGKYPDVEEQQKEIQEKQFNEYASQIVGNSSHFVNAAKGFSSAIGRGIVSLAQVPKIFGDATGDKDYDWADELYDSTESFLQSKEKTFAQAHGEEIPLSYKLSRMFGEGVGSVVLFATGAGGASTNAGRYLATTGTAFLTQEADAYKEALAAGMNPQEAAIAGSTVAAVTAMVEGIIPDSRYFQAPAFRQSIIKNATAAVRSGKTAKEAVTGAIKGAMKAMPESAKHYLTTVPKVGAKEALEEVTQQFAGDVSKEVINGIVDNDYQNVWDKEAYIDAVLGGFMVGGGITSISRPGPKSPVQEDVLLTSTERMDELVKNVQATNPEKAAEIESELEESSVILEGLKGSPSFESLPREKQAHVLSELVRKKQMEDVSKTIGVEDEKTKAEIAAIDENVKSILDTGFTPAELEQQKIDAEEEKLQAQPETLTEGEIAIKQSLGEKIYTPEDIDSMIEQDEVIEECPPGYVKAEKGLKTGFKPGGKWTLVEEFKGKTHDEGGIDIEITGGKIKYSDEEGGVKLKGGGFFSVLGDTGKFIGDLAIGQFMPNAIKASDYDTKFFANTSSAVEGFTQQLPWSKLASAIRNDTMEERTAGMNQEQVDLYNMGARIGKPISKIAETAVGAAIPLAGAGFSAINAMNKNTGELSLPEEVPVAPAFEAPELTAQQQLTEQLSNEVSSINNPMNQMQTVNINGVTYGFKNGQFVQI